MKLATAHHWLIPTLRLGSVLVSGCIATPTVPLDTLYYPSRATGHEENLLVLLRGIGASHHIFEEEGIIEEIRRRQLPFDVVAPDTHFGYYDAQTLEDRLKADIIDPARAQGYRQVWLAGFSMGGLGSLFYLRKHPDDVDGVFLVSPFLGWDAILHEIKDAGGVDSWGETTADASDWSRLLWSWIKVYSAAPKDYPPIFLGYGRNDWLADEGPPLLATVLPEQRVVTAPGNHTVGTFKLLFSRHLDRLAELFPVAPATVAADPRSLPPVGTPLTPKEVSR